MQPQTVVIIPARGGSKRLPGKNIKILQGKPMIAYAIEAAKKASLVERVIVSTDDEAIAAVARAAGAEVPFFRPADLASDTAKTIDVLQHAVILLEEQGTVVGRVVLVQATSPLVLAQDIDTALEVQQRTGTHSCVSVCAVSERPEWMFTPEGERLTKFLPADSSTRSQDLPPLVRLNGAVYVVQRDVLMNQNVLIDNDSVSHMVMPKERSVDIDDAFDFFLAEQFLSAGFHKQ